MTTLRFKQTAWAGLIGLALVGAVAVLPQPSKAGTQATIVQGKDLATVKATVETVGGQVTHELGIIKAVGVKLTDAQRAKLSSIDGLRLISDNALGINSSTAYVRDNFDVISYANNDGNAQWKSEWIETRDPYDLGPQSGNVRVQNGKLVINRYGRGAQRAIDLPVGSSATLDFKLKHTDLSAPEHYVKVQVSGAGQNFTEIGRISGPHTNGAKVRYTFDISDFSGPDTIIRLITANANGTEQEMKFEYVKVEYTTDVVTTAIIEHVFDSFTTPGYDNNEGSVNFNSSWVETGDDGNGMTGKVLVDGDLGELRLKGSRSVERSVDLSVGSGARLNFEYRLWNLEADDEYKLEVSPDGGATYVVLDRLRGIHDPNAKALLIASYDLSPYASADTRIRFSSENADGSDSDRLNIDNFGVTYTNAPDTHYPALVGADQLHGKGIDGEGIGIAVVDTGYFPHEKSGLQRRRLPTCIRTVRRHCQHGD